VASISSQAAFESLETSDIAALGFTAAEVETVTRELNQRSAEEQLMVERALAESMQELVSGLGKMHSYWTRTHHHNRQQANVR